MYIHNKLFITLLLLFFIHSFPSNVHCKRVAIIGAGIAGGSAAYYTNQFDSDTEIHVFEKSNRIGGRMKHVTIGGQICEVGADAWSSVNEYLVQLQEALNVPLSNNTFAGNGLMGLYEGGGKWYNPTTNATAEELFYTQIELFELHLRNNYAQRDLNNNFKAFLTVAGFTLYGNLDTYTNVNTYGFGSKYGISQQYLWDQVLPLIRGIYDQTLNISAFAGIVSVLPSVTPGYAVLGGNSILVETLLNNSGATVHLNTPITEIKTGLGYWNLLSNKASFPEFDSVVIANPIEFSNISFEGVNIQVTPRKFVHWFVTLTLAESLNPSYFGNIAPVPDNVFTTGNSTAPFVVCYPLALASSGSIVYKMFSNQDVTAYLEQIFIGVQDYYVEAWPFTFPDLSPSQSYQPVILAPNLYYTSGIESVATAMEMSTIAGRNAALLISNPLAAIS